MPNDQRILAELQAMKQHMDNIVRLLAVAQPPEPDPKPETPNCFTEEDVMPFGKHRGVKLRQLPSDYRTWLLGQDKLSHPGLEAWRKKTLAARSSQVETQIAEQTEGDPDVPF